MAEGIFQLTGNKNGPTSIILAGVHGDEKSGVEALNDILSNLKIEAGTVFFGYGNPQAMDTNKRFVDSDLNRMFKKEEMLSDENKKSYEYKRAEFLKSYFDKAEVLLDLHTSRTPDSKPFTICEENAMDIVRFLPVGLAVSGFDEIEPGGTDYYMNSIGKIGICMECGFSGSDDSRAVAKAGVLSFLKARGHISNDLNSNKQDRVQVYKLYISKTDKFVLAKSFGDFERILAGQVIGIDGDEEVKAEEDAVILFARNRDKVGAEAFILGKI